MTEADEALWLLNQLGGTAPKKPKKAKPPMPVRSGAVGPARPAVRLAAALQLLLLASVLQLWLGLGACSHGKPACLGPPP